MIELFLTGLITSLRPENLLAIVFGVTWGIIGGAIPGITGSLAMALLLPFTFGMTVYQAVPMLAAVYVGAEYGSSIPAILIKTPGSPSSAVTVADGYALHLKGEGGKALTVSLVSGFIGGFISVILLVAFAIPLSRFGLMFGPSQFALLGIMGLSVVGSITGGNMFKGLLSAAFGLLLTTIGLDPFVGTPRFTFGYFRLLEGLSIIPIIIGLFAIGEVLIQVSSRNIHGKSNMEKVRFRWPSKEDFKRFVPVACVGGFIGTFIGVIPGPGTTVAAFVSYNQVRQFCKNKENFGKGDIRGIAAPESANNACPAGTLVPLLALGIPGSNAAAIVLVGFSIHGVQLGPRLFAASPEIPYAIMASMMVAQFLMLGLGFFMIRPIVKITSISPKYMAIAIIMFGLIGAFATTNDPFAMVIACIFGVIGFLMKKFGFSPAATVLAFVLGRMIENNLRRALVLSDGSLDIFFSGPINIVLVTIIFGTLFFSVFDVVRKRFIK